MSDTSSRTPSDAELNALFQRLAAAMQSGDAPRALAMADQAINAGAEHPHLLKIKGIALHNLGRYREALKALHHARTLDGGDPYILNAIASCLTFMGGPDAALKVVEESLELAPDAPGTQYLKGWVLEALGDLPPAREAYQAAEKETPNNPQALAGLASVAAQLGDFETARDAAQKALAQIPAHPTATLALARAEAALGDAPAAQARLQEMLKARSQLPLTAVTRAFGQLGDVLDAQDKVDDAFAAYRERARAFRTAYREAKPNAPSPAETVSGLASRLAEMTAESWKPASPAATDPGSARTHVFLLGFMRSGTTLLEQVLNAHPDVVIAKDRDILHDAAATHLASPAAMERFAGLDDAALEPMREAYWNQVRETGIDPAGKIFVERNPLNTAKLPLIAKLFPNAKILFAVRDPRDAVLSGFRQHFMITDDTADVVSLEGTARLYASHMELATAGRDKLALAIHECRYEALAERFDETVQAACAFLGIEWTDAMREAEQIRRPLDSSAAGQWQRYATHMNPVIPTIEPWIRSFGYAGN